MSHSRLCECGCGLPTLIAKTDRKATGVVRGQPRRFIEGHAVKGSRHKLWRGDQASYSAIHAYLRRHFPKSGICDECGERKPTDYALIHGRPYSRDRDDYQELCRLCHNRYDGVGGSRWRGVVRIQDRAGKPPLCPCGCGTQVPWDSRRSQWQKYAVGHYRPSRPPAPPLRPIRCAYCANVFMPRRRDMVYCSKACKAAQRRAAGNDDVGKACHVCDGWFASNRYDKTKHCSQSCAATCQHAGKCPAQS